MMIKDPEQDEEEVVVTMSNHQVEEELFFVLHVHFALLFVSFLITIVIALSTEYIPAPDVKQHVSNRKACMFFLLCTVILLLSLVLHPYMRNRFNQDVSRWMNQNLHPHRIRIFQGGTLIGLSICGVIYYLSQIYND
jgi:membrane-anchored glycerophosphoryl diester phosphodiesterase (GDPDase)